MTHKTFSGLSGAAFAILSALMFFDGAWFLYGWVLGSPVTWGLALACFLVAAGVQMYMVSKATVRMATLDIEEGSR